MMARMLVRLSFVVVVVLVLLLDVRGVHAESELSVADLLREANAALTSYDYGKALEAFDKAVEKDPGAYLTYFRRATAQQALGRNGAALADLNLTIERQPQFGKAYLQQVRIHLKEGEYEAALGVINRMTSTLGKDHAQELAQASTLHSQVAHAQSLSKRLAALAKGSDAAACVRVADELVKAAPNDLDARQHRATCRLALGHVDDAVTDWNRIVALAPNPALQLRLSLVSFYLLGSYDSQMYKAGLQHLKACLHNDPDNKACIRAHKQLRKIDKALAKAHKFAASSSWPAVVSALKGPKVGAPTIYEEVQSVLRAASTPGAHGERVLPRQIKDPLTQSELLHDMDTLYCRAYVGQNLFKKGMPYCDRLLQRDPNSIPALVAKGEDHIANQRYDEAVHVLQQAFMHTQQTDRDVYQRLNKAQKLQKQAKSKDYYKTLGVARDADERTIKKAYRRLVLEHHPDKGGDQDKMAEINEAFGVIGDPEQRKRYDAGDDPNDPAGQQQAHEGGFGANEAFAQMFQNGAFQQFGRNQGGGGQQFHFSF